MLKEQADERGRFVPAAVVVEFEKPIERGGMRGATAGVVKTDTADGEGESEAARATAVASLASESGAAERGTGAGKGGVSGAATSFDDDAPNWPDEMAETVFLSEQRYQGGEVSVEGTSTGTSGAGGGGKSAVDDDAPLPKGAMPTLDVLIARIPAETRETLEELFRVKFTDVRRVPKSAMK